MKVQPASQPNVQQVSGFSTLLTYWLAMTLVVVAVSLGILAFIDRVDYQQQVQREQSDSSMRLAHAARYYADHLSEALKAGAIAASNARVIDFLSQPYGVEQAPVDTVLLQLMGLYPEFYQARLINNQGMEVRRVNRLDGQFLVVEAQQLQDKASRPYVRQGLKLGANEILVSPINLNVERDQIEKPFRPVFRIVVPVYAAQGQRLGLVVINYDVKKLQRELLNLFPADQGKAMLVSESGDWMVAPQAGWAWAEQLGHEQRFSSQYSAAWQKLNDQNHGHFEISNDWFAHERLVINAPDTFTIQGSQSLGRLIIHRPDSDFAWQPIQHARSQLAALGLLVVSLSVLCWWLARLWLEIGFRRQQRQQDLEQLRLAGAIFDNTDEALVVTDAKQRIISCNNAITHITGYTPAEVIGKTPRLWASDKHDPRFYDELWTALQFTGQWQGQITNQHKDGHCFHAWENISAVRNEDGKIVNYVAIMTDISKLKSVQNELQHLAYHDVLSQLPNRLMFKNNLDQLAEVSRRSHGRFAVAMIDLDGFKVINDSLGHHAGDELIKVISKRLRDTARKEDTVARLGGDEFALILPSVNSPETGALTMQRVLNHLQEMVRLHGRQIFPKASIGVALFPQDGDNAVDLVKAADSAMYEAKRLRSHSFVFHSAELNTRAIRRMEVEQSLRRALQQRELRLQYQPQIDLTTGEVIGFEALLRWLHPERGLISAGEFIPIAEESGLIDDIGFWVIEESCRQAREWLDRGTSNFRIAVNLSGHQLGHSNVQSYLAKALNKYSIKGNRILLELEMTESMLMQEPHILELLNQFRHQGFSLALDDFGTGYSSLAQLRHLPVDRLKIAGVFVRDIEHDKEAQAIVKTIIRLGRDMNMTVLAEEIENRQQLAFLQQAGCDEAQGYYFSKSLDADAAEAFFRERKSVAILNRA